MSTKPVVSVRLTAWGWDLVWAYFQMLTMFIVSYLHRVCLHKLTLTVPCSTRNALASIYLFFSVPLSPRLSPGSCGSLLEGFYRHPRECDAEAYSHMQILDTLTQWTLKDDRGEVGSRLINRLLSSSCTSLVQMVKHVSRKWFDGVPRSKIQTTNVKKKTTVHSDLTICSPLSVWGQLASHH